MSYTKNTWNTGDVVTAAKLNNMENGIEANAEELGKIVILNIIEDDEETVTDLTAGELKEVFENELPVICICFGIIIGFASVIYGGMPGEETVQVFAYYDEVTINNDPTSMTVARQTYYGEQADLSQPVHFTEIHTWVNNGFTLAD